MESGSTSERSLGDRFALLRAGHTAVLQGVDIDARDSNGRTTRSSRSAPSSDEDEASIATRVEHLLDLWRRHRRKGAQWNDRDRGCCPTARNGLSRSCCNVNQRWKEARMDGLTHAVSYGDLSLIKRLLDLAAKIENKDRDGNAQC